LADEEDFLKKIGNSTGVGFIDLASAEIEESAIEAVTANIATHYNIMPVQLQADKLIAATCEPFFEELTRELQLVLDAKFKIEFVLATAEAIQKSIRKHYGLGAATVEQMALVEDLQQSTEGTSDLLDNDEKQDASVIKLVNQILADAIKADATDIHIEPYEDELRARYRIDGILQNAPLPQSARFFKEGIISRVKIFSGLDIAEKRLPQDGRSQVNLGGERFDLRISILPTRFGEAINIRILPQSKLIMQLGSLGMEEKTVSAIKKLIDRPHGIILVTGPTGSGKTTTLYTCMHMLKDSNRKIITIEDPIEYEMKGLMQMQTHSEIGFTFARALRSMLRHDPDIMLVGEIRDFETAETAIRTALTGHLVFSTLHTNDAASAITRLLDMGVEPFLTASSINAVLAQRLVRMICPHCKESCDVPDEIKIAVKSITHSDKIESFYHGKGCSKCHFTGYLGRTAITEMLTFSQAIRQMTIDRRDSSEINTQARKEGMSTLFEAGLRKVRQAITTYQEVVRVTNALPLTS
jgi:type II secretory ATPase GspE/PulE/Tfp pilus assembly ATPase PilB-like protein